MSTTEAVINLFNQNAPSTQELLQDSTRCRLITNLVLVLDPSKGTEVYGEALADYMADLLDHFSKLSHFSLHLSDEDQKLPVRALNCLFQRYKGTLTVLKINAAFFACVCGYPEDFQVFTHQLSAMPKLQTLNFGGIRTRGDSCDWVLIGPGYDENAHLSVFREPIVGMLSSLFDNCIGLVSLRELVLPCFVDVKFALKCLQLLAGNQTLESLTLRVFSPYSADKNDETVNRQFKEAIQSLGALSHFSLVWGRPLGLQTYQVASSIIQGLPGAHTLSSFHFSASTNWNNTNIDSFNKDIDRMLIANSTLTELDVDIVGLSGPKKLFHLSSEASFWLKTNQCGRKALLEDLQSQTWRSTLIEQKDDHPVTFFLLSANIAFYLPYLLGGEKTNSKQRVVISGVSPRRQKKQKIDH